MHYHIPLHSPPSHYYISHIIIIIIIIIIVIYRIALHYVAKPATQAYFVSASAEQSIVAAILDEEAREGWSESKRDPSATMTD